MSKKFGSQETVDIVRKFSALVNSSRDYYKELYETVGRCDRETSDMVHDIEFSTFNAKEGNLKARTLRKIRRERRAAKDEMEYVVKFKKIAETYKSLGKELETLCSELTDIRSTQSTRTYTPKEKPVIIGEEE